MNSYPVALLRGINPAFKKVTFIYNSSTIKYAAYAPRLGMYLLAGLIVEWRTGMSAPL